jgi:transcriptional regulator with XRE-family HTH domain
MELKEIGKKIKNLRLANGLTLDELAVRSELSKGFLSQLERGQMSPSLDNLGFILEALGTTLGIFFSTEKKIKNVFNQDDMSINEDGGITTK